MTAIRETGEVYIVEGYMDVVGLAMYGVHNVIACCGTALTEHHLKRLSGLCGKVHLLFDGDEAGRSAAAKSFASARNADLDVTACFLPDDVDPDDFAKQHSERTPEALRELPKALLIDVFVDGVLRSHGCGEGEKPGPNLLGKICEEIARSLRGIQREVVLSSLLSRVARRLVIEVGQLERLVNSERDGNKAKRSEPAPVAALRETPADPGHGSKEASAPGRVEEKRSPSQLPKSDLALLRVVMVLREQVLEEVISNGDVCESLSPEALQFMLGLSEMISEFGSDDERLKARIKEYLQELGPEWVALWKEAHTIILKSEEGALDAYQKTLHGFKRDRLNRLLKECQQELARHADDPQLQAEVFERMRSLKSQLDSMARG
jgi:DNA primase